MTEEYTQLNIHVFPTRGAKEAARLLMKDSGISHYELEVVRGSEAWNDHLQLKVTNQAAMMLNLMYGTNISHVVGEYHTQHCREIYLNVLSELMAIQSAEPAESGGA